MSRQRLGQNFLIDDAVKKAIVECFDPPAAFAEIGPGHGEITKLLEARFQDREFLVIEKDTKLAETHRSFARYPVWEGDFLDWPWTSPKTREPVGSDFSLIGNLPYESGSKMLLKMSELSHQLQHFVFLLQKEVVERICAKPHTSDFSSFTVIIQGQFIVEPLLIVPPSAFRPAPQVVSQVVRGHRRSDPHSLSAPYLKFLKAAFLQKRKTLRNSLKSSYAAETLSSLHEHFKLPPTARAEEIEVDLWPKIYEFIGHLKDKGTA